LISTVSWCLAPEHLAQARSGREDGNQFPLTKPPVRCLVSIQLRHDRRDAFVSAHSSDVEIAINTTCAGTRASTRTSADDLPFAKIGKRCRRLENGWRQNIQPFGFLMRPLFQCETPAKILIAEKRQPTRRN
jgi:hypothetical protein